MVPPESGGLINLYGKVFSFACARVDGIRSEPTLKGGLDKISVAISDRMCEPLWSRLEL